MHAELIQEWRAARTEEAVGPAKTGIVTRIWSTSVFWLQLKTPRVADCCACTYFNIRVYDGPSFVLQVYKQHG